MSGASAERLGGVDPTLYIVTDTAQCAGAGRSVAATVAEAVAGGAHVVQVRDKDVSDADFRALADEVLAAVARTRAVHGIDREVPVFLNDRVAVARDLLDAGERVHVHVGQSDMDPAEVRRLLGDEPLIGLSAATPEEFAAGRATGAVDMFGIGPVYDTTTKADAPSGLGPVRLAELAGVAGLPSVGIGGIDAARAAELGTAGLAARGVVGICVVSAICTADDPRAAASAIRAAYLGGAR
ncbi:thiamine phosphate synthase [Brevibacterium litoralis]|uniref:thiamine phosphate synthase n=1 Tax=Brevibacterium litoralis TaxID=3138935 RepID=UPI0032EC4647